MAPPPKLKAKPVEDEKPKAEEPKEVTGANAFATVAFGGALAGRGRGARGGRDSSRAGAKPGGGSAPKRPLTAFVPTAPSTTEDNKVEEESKVVKTEPD